MKIMTALRLLLVLLSLVGVDLASAALPYTSTTRQAGITGIPLPPAGTPANPWGMVPADGVIGDFNNDGSPDLLIVTDFGSCMDPSYCTPTFNYPSVLFYPGDSLGQFGIASGGSNSMDPGPPVQAAITIRHVQAADLNHDGNLDIVFSAWTNAYDDGVYVSYGDGHGGFSGPAVALPLPGSFSQANAIALKDVNHDGWVDIVVTDRFNTLFTSGSDILVYLNDGHGHFPAYDQYGTPTWINSTVVLTDWGGDGNADIVGIDEASSGNKGLIFLKGNSDGTFQDWVTKIPQGTVPSYLTGGSGGYTGATTNGTAADLDGDGHVDYVVGDMGGGVWWFKGHGNDTFDNAVRLAAPPVTIAEYNANASNLGHIVVGNFGGNGRKDIAYAGVIYLRQADGSYVADTPVLCPPTSKFSCSFLAGRDLNGDGRPDLVATNPDPNLVTIYTSSHGFASNLLIVGGDNQSTVFNTAFLTPLRVRVVDAGGFAVPNAEIWYQPPAGLTASAVIPGGHGWTDAQGYFSATATANNTIGSYTVDVTGLTTNNITLQGAFNLNNTAANSLLISSGTPQSAMTSTLFAQPLVAQVLDGSNQPVAGIIVSFTAPSLTGGGASAKLATSIPGFGAATNTVTAVTDASGYASVFAQSNATTGTYNVSVSAPFYATTTGSFTLTNRPIPGAAAQVLLTPSTASSLIGTQYAAPLLAQIADSAGVSVSGTMHSVTFDQTNDPATAAGVLMSTGSTPCTNGTAGPLTVPSNFQGQATIYVCASGTPGQFAVRAGVNDPNISQTSATLRNRAPSPGSIVLYGGTPQTTTINTAFTQTLQVQVLTSGGQPAPFAPVFFVAPSSGPSATLSATLVATDQNGIASVTATANGEVGNYIVTARVIGDVANPTVDFALDNAAPVASTPTPVPTQSEVGLMLLSLLLASTGLRRRHS